MFTILTLFTLTTLITGSGTSIDRICIKIFPLKKSRVTYYNITLYYLFFRFVRGAMSINLFYY